MDKKISHYFQSFGLNYVSRINALIGAGMYQMDQLLNLLTAEKAQELQFRAGSPPILVSEREHHFLQGPPMTTEELLTLFRCLASSREVRELRDFGKLHFVYTAPGRTPFLVQAKMEAERIAFEVS